MCISALEAGVLLFQYGRKFLKGRREILSVILLTFLFLGYNGTILFEEAGRDLATSVFGGMLSAYYFYYIFSNLLPSGTRTTALLLVVSGLVITTMVSFVVFTITGSIQQGLYPILMGSFFCIGVIVSVYSSLLRYNRMFSNTLTRLMIAFVVIVILSIALVFERHGSLYVITTNLFFLVVLLDQWLKRLFRTEGEFFISEISFFPEGILEPACLDDYELSSQQRYIAEEFLKGTSPKVIARHLDLKGGTITKHLSNIYKKTNCKGGMQEFLIRFSNCDKQGGEPST